MPINTMYQNYAMTRILTNDAYYILTGLPGFSQSSKCSQKLHPSMTMKQSSFSMIHHVWAIKHSTCLLPLRSTTSTAICFALSLITVIKHFKNCLLTVPISPPLIPATTTTNSPPFALLTMNLLLIFLRLLLWLVPKLKLPGM